jgi:hypothetical protein
MVIPSQRLVQPDPKFPLDLKIVDFLRDQPEAVSSWRLVNAVAAVQHPVNRDESRELKMRILRRITPLVYANRVRGSAGIIWAFAEAP